MMMMMMMMIIIIIIMKVEHPSLWAHCITNLAHKCFLVISYRRGGTSLDNHPKGLHPFNASAGDSITDQYFMGGDSE